MGESDRAGDAWEDLFQRAPCGYLTLDADGRVTRVNETFSTWTGHRGRDLEGTAFGRLLPVGDRILWSVHSAPQLAAGDPVSEVVVEIVGADGVRRPALVSATRARGADGDEVRVIVFSAPERRAHERELVAALQRVEASDDARVAAEVEARRQALADPLTGLPNRAGLLVHLQAAVGREPCGVGVFVVDLDHFSVVNESLGAQAGDELLLTVAQRLGAAVREGAVVARSSADEFVVVDPCTDVAAARALGERLLQALTVPVVLAGLEVVTSASIGAAVAGSGPAQGERALHDAGVAVQRAKARGRSRVEVHDPATSKSGAAADRLRLLGELRRGIPDGQLRLHHQPQLRLSGRTLLGVEALVRWEHPTRGLLAPGEFIDLAEQSGLVRELGAWVLDAAVQQAAEWARDRRAVTLAVAVNLSARQLAEPGLVVAVADALERHDLPADLLTLEVTETALVADPVVAAGVLAELKDLGVGISVDDFGTGYASLTYLQRFPVDELKVDRSFISGLGRNAGDTAIVKACVQLAHAVGVRAVAEGVESEEQRDLLDEMGCDVVQGFLFSRPLPAEPLQRWARSWQDVGALTGAVAAPASS